MLDKYRTDLLLLLHNLPLLIMLYIGINALHGDAPSILFPTSLLRADISKVKTHERFKDLYQINTQHSEFKNLVIFDFC
jgi:hypothetical protein